MEELIEWLIGLVLAIAWIFVFDLIRIAISRLRKY